MADYIPTPAESPETPNYAGLRADLAAAKKGSFTNATQRAFETMTRVHTPAETASEKRGQTGVLPLECTGAACTGDVNLGIFFDGTDNNKDRDYGRDDNNPHPFLRRYHTNVVRLYHAYPDEDDAFRKKALAEGSTNRCYSYYVPGVGTVFNDVGDIKELPTWEAQSMAGSGMGWGCEPRILWAMAQVLNAISRFYNDETIINQTELKGVLVNMCSIYKEEPRINIAITNAVFKVPVIGDYIGPAVDTASHFNFVSFTTGVARDEERRAQFKIWLDRLRVAVKPEVKPRLNNLNLHVFGFSRGAAEARAFVNWLRELDDSFDPAAVSDSDNQKDGLPADHNIITILGFIKLRVHFLGILDTVASVGLAGLFAFSEGRAAWADNNLEIPHYVGQCVHMVAGHEVRACFPLDSVRENANYPGNAVEIVYPGGHSDLGGGYPLRALGKNDLGDETNEEDLQIARVVAFDMYCRARREGVPFYSIAQLRKINNVAANALLPDERAINWMDAYQCLCQLRGGVEDHLRQHTAYYLGWRWQSGPAYFGKPEYLDKEFLRIKEKITSNEKQLELCQSSLAENRRLREEELNRPNREIRPAYLSELRLLYNELEHNEKRLLAEKEPLEIELAARRQACADNAVTSPEIDLLNEARTTTVKSKQDGKKTAKDEAGYLMDTQCALIQVVAGYCRQINARLENEHKDYRDGNFIAPLNNPLAIFNCKDEVDPEETYKKVTQTATKAAIFLLLPAAKVRAVITGISAAYSIAKIAQERMHLLTDNLEENIPIAMQATQYLKKWRDGLKKAGLKEQHKLYAPEREAIWLLEALADWEKIRPEYRKIMGNFFAANAHDSMAGFIGKGMPEFQINGYGIAKFRRVFFGNTGDAFLRERIKTENLVRSGHIRKIIKVDANGNPLPDTEAAA
jgi:hypothetical protein